MSKNQKRNKLSKKNSEDQSHNQSFQRSNQNQQSQQLSDNHQNQQSQSEDGGDQNTSCTEDQEVSEECKSNDGDELEDQMLDNLALSSQERTKQVMGSEGNIQSQENNIGFQPPKFKFKSKAYLPKKVTYTLAELMKKKKEYQDEGNQKCLTAIKQVIQSMNLSKKRLQKQQKARDKAKDRATKIRQRQARLQAKKDRQVVADRKLAEAIKRKALIRSKAEEEDRRKAEEDRRKAEEDRRKAEEDSRKADEDEEFLQQMQLELAHHEGSNRQVSNLVDVSSFFIPQQTNPTNSGTYQQHRQSQQTIIPMQNYQPSQILRCPTCRKDFIQHFQCTLAKILNQLPNLRKFQCRCGHQFCGSCLREHGLKSPPYLHLGDYTLQCMLCQDVHTYGAYDIYNQDGLVKLGVPQKDLTKMKKKKSKKKRQSKQLSPTKRNTSNDKDGKGGKGGKRPRRVTRKQKKN